jgi:class 3 adenylate cyclase
VLFILYVALSSSPTTELEAPPATWFISLQIVLLVVPFVAGDYLGKRWDAQLRNWYLNPNTTAPHQASPVIQRRALNSPAHTALITLLMWIVAGLFFGVTSSFYSGRFSWVNFALTFLSVGGFAGSISATLVYFINERLWQPEIPIFFPEGHVSKVAAFRVTVQRRMLAIFVLGSIPVVLLAFSGYRQAHRIAQAPDPAAELPRFLQLEGYLLFVALLMTLTLALTLGVSMVRSVNALRIQMQRVQQGDLEARAPVHSNDEFGELNEGFNAMVKGLQEEAIIRTLFSRYVTPQVAEHAITHGAELGGQQTVATVLFSDIRGFTSLTERLPADTLISLLNRYFEVMSAVVQAEDGVINKFGGDSLLAIFGTPLYPQDEHADAAVRTAQGMLRQLRSFNEEQKERGEPILRIGIGIATGLVVVGNVGSTSRMEYTVIGDTVNLASRLEALTKTHAADVLIAESTVAKLDEAPLPLERLGLQSVRGKHRPIVVYGLKTTD